MFRGCFWNPSSCICTPAFDSTLLVNKLLFFYELLPYEILVHFAFMFLQNILITMATNHVSNGNEDSHYSNNVVQALMTDLYQVTMAYSYWQNERTNDRACFDLFFRKNPFGGEFTLYAGLSDCLKFLQNFTFTDSGRKQVCRHFLEILLLEIDCKHIQWVALREVWTHTLDNDTY